MRVRTVARAALMFTLIGASFKFESVASGDDRVGGHFGGGPGSGHSHGGAFGGSALPYGWNLPSSGFHNPVPSFGGSIQPLPYGGVHYGGGAIAPYYSGGLYYSGSVISSRAHSNSWNGSYDNFKFNTVGPPSPYSPYFLRGSVAGVFILPPQSFAAGYGAPGTYATGRFRYRPLNYGYGGLGYGPTGFGYSFGLGK